MLLPRPRGRIVLTDLLARGQGFSIERGEAVPEIGATRPGLRHFVRLPEQRLSARDFDRQVGGFQVRVAVRNGFTALGTPITVTLRRGPS